MEKTNYLAFTVVLIGAVMGFGRDWLTSWYLWVFRKMQKTEPPPRLGAIFKLYLVFTSFIFTVVGILGLLGIWKY